MHLVFFSEVSIVLTHTTHVFPVVYFFHFGEIFEINLGALKTQVIISFIPQKPPLEDVEVHWKVRFDNFTYICLTRIA